MRRRRLRSRTSVLVAWALLAVAILTAPAVAAAGEARLTATDSLKTWRSQPYSPNVTLHVSVQRHHQPLGVHPHTDGCSATYSGKGVIALLSICGRHLTVKYVSASERRRGFAVFYRVH